jgi:iron(III) transport system substrate-binding protein
MNLTITKVKRATKARFLAAVLGSTVAASCLSVMSVSAATSHTSVPTILLYNAQGYGDKVAAAFNSTNPGFKIVVDDDSTGPLFTKIQAEMAAGSPKWGLFWADGATEFAALDKLGYLVKNVIPSTSSYNAAGLSNIPKDKSFAPTGLTVTGALCYDSVATKGVTLPSTMAGLTSAAKGLLGMNNPSQSGPTFPLIAGVMAHLGGITPTMNPTTSQVNAAIAKGEAFYSALKKNGLQVHNTNGPTLGAMESNPATLDMATIQSSACYGDVNAQPKPLWTTGKVKYLDYSVALPSNIGVDSKLSPKLQADAEKFVAYVTSAKGQLAMQHGDPYGDGLFWPVIKGVNPEKYLPSFSVTHAYAINPYVWGPLENQINTWFTNNIVN